LLNAAIGFGAILSGIGGGYIWESYSPIVALLLASIVVFIGLFVLQISVRMKREERLNN
jgi:predicted MFS family arabinose efflux permease